MSEFRKAIRTRKHSPRISKTKPSVLSDARWRAITLRDSKFNGRFVFGVLSTGIYCCPSCPARRPKRRNVVFFDSPEKAEMAGYRPCRRCHPRNVQPNPGLNLIGHACNLIEAAEMKGIPLADLASACNVSPTHLQRIFRRYLGVSPRGYAEAIRLKRLKSQLKHGEDVTTAIYAAGYGSSSRLYERSNRQLGMTPGTYRRGGKDMEIEYSITASPQGRLLVAGTKRGISAVYLGDQDKELETQLRREYPRAHIRRNSANVCSWVKALVRYLSGQQTQLDLPLDVTATAFQRLVWEHLQKIPYGETRTYSEVSEELGRATATRAVARACATNPVSLIIPCHRVVRGDGSLAGYRWGIERKRSLLQGEKSVRDAVQPKSKSRY